MNQLSNGSNEEIKLGGIWLYVNDKVLTVRRRHGESLQFASPDDLSRIVTSSLGTVIPSLEEIAAKNVSDALALGNSPDKLDPMPWVHAIQLASAANIPSVLTEEGLTPPYQEASHTLHYSKTELVPALHEYWDAITAINGLYVRAGGHYGGGSTPQYGGLWLQYRSTPPKLPQK